MIGKVGSPVGIRGEFRITLYSQDSGNLKEGKTLLLERTKKLTEGTVLPVNFSAPSQIEAKIKRVRYQKDKPVVKLEGIEDRNAAEAVRGMEVSIRACDLEELPEGEHYVRDLIGFTVVDVAAGDEVDKKTKRTVPGVNPGVNGVVVGTLKDVIQNTAQSILEVETDEGKTVLIPAVDQFLKEIDDEEGVIKVELIPGFID